MGGFGSAVLVLGLLFVGALAKPKVGINFQHTFVSPHFEILAIAIVEQC